MSQATTQSQPAQQPFVARAGKTYRRYRYVMFVLMVAFGGWFLYDGFVRWPEQNKAWDAKEAQILQLDVPGRTAEMTTTLEKLRREQKDMPKRHNDFDLGLQRTLGFALPPIAVALLTFWRRRSRGEYRLQNDILNVPGYPPIPLTSIESLDKTRWDRKGIAFANYKLPNGLTGTVRLDDFIYDAYPIRDMVKAIEDSILARATTQQPKA